MTTFQVKNTNDEIDFPNEKLKDLIKEITMDEKIVTYVTKLTSATSKGDNYLGIIYRAVVNGTTLTDEKKELNLILKMTPPYPRDKFPIEEAYKREIFAYCETLPALYKLQEKFNIPMQDRFNYIKYYKGDLTYMIESLILEDMSKQGYVMGNRQGSIGPAQMRLLMKELAALHAASFALEKHDNELFQKLMSKTVDPEDFNHEMFLHSVKIAYDRALGAIDDEDHKKRFSEFGQNIGEKLFNFNSKEPTVPYNVCCHGDCWTNNILFRYENDKPVEVRLLDWQMVKHASPIVDIAYLMFSSTDENLRANHYEELLNIYYDTLKTNLALMECDVNVCYPREIFEKQIKTIMPFGLIMAFLTAPMFMSEEEDIVDMNELMKKDQINEDDMQLKNEKSKSRYEERMRGVVRDFVRLGLI